MVRNILGLHLSKVNDENISFEVLLIEGSAYVISVGIIMVCLCLRRCRKKPTDALKQKARTEGGTPSISSPFRKHGVKFKMRTKRSWHYEGKRKVGRGRLGIR